MGLLPALGGAQHRQGQTFLPSLCSESASVSGTVTPCSVAAAPAQLSQSPLRLHSGLPTFSASSEHLKPSQLRCYSCKQTRANAQGTLPNTRLRSSEITPSGENQKSNPRDSCRCPIPSPWTGRKFTGATEKEHAAAAPAVASLEREFRMSASRWLQHLHNGHLEGKQDPGPRQKAPARIFFF